jgi:hypothetical protein
VGVSVGINRFETHDRKFWTLELGMGLGFTKYRGRSCWARCRDHLQSMKILWYLDCHSTLACNPY